MTCCRVIKTGKGNVARVNSEKPSTPEEERALERLIDCATDHMRSNIPTNALPKQQTSETQK